MKFVRICSFIVSLLMVASSIQAFGANATERDAEAHALVEIVSQRPENMQVRCRLTTRGPDGRGEALIRYSTVVSEGGWQGIYERLDTAIAEQLVVLHRDGLPNQYVYRKGPRMGEAERPVVLDGSEASIPFAGSEFWLSDLGLEFLHWPEQRLVRDRKITMRKGRPCKILESANPGAQNGYARVLSWIDAEYGGLIYAEGYDSKGKLMKVFSIGGFKKINGAYHPKELEIRNEKDDSRTLLEFLFDE